MNLNADGSESPSHEHETFIRCPYCNHDLLDCIDYPEDGTETCGYCGSEFSFRRHREITYSTYGLRQSNRLR